MLTLWGGGWWSWFEEQASHNKVNHVVQVLLGYDVFEPSERRRGSLRLKHIHAASE